MNVPSFIVTLGGLARLARRLPGMSPAARPWRRWTPPSASWAAAARRFDRRHLELGRRRDRLPADHRRHHRLAPAAKALRLSAPSALGGIFPCRPRLRAWSSARSGSVQQLLLADQHRQAIRRGPQYSLAGDGLGHSLRHRRSGSDRRLHRHRHDLHRHAPALRPLCLRDRRQSGSSRTRRHQDPLGHGAHLRADGLSRAVAAAISTARLNAATNSQGTTRRALHHRRSRHRRHVARRRQRHDRRRHARRAGHAIAAIGHGVSPMSIRRCRTSSSASCWSWPSGSTPSIARAPSKRNSEP